VAIVILGALLFSSDAQACSCVEPNPRSALRQADAAIIGHVVGVVPLDDYNSDYLVRVHRVFKGDDLGRGMTIAVRSGPNGASCGLPSAGPRRYGMFLGRGEDGWRGSLCALTRPRELVAATAGFQRNGDLDPASASVSDCAS
jgi:hypothetical protein